MNKYGPSPAESRFNYAMAKAKEAEENGSSVGVREWLEAAHAAQRIVELQRLSALGRAGEALCRPQP